MIESLLSTKRQVKYFDQSNYPTTDDINSILQLAYKLTPSKQNLMPYTVHVLGPDKHDHKAELFRLASGSERPDANDIRIVRPKTGNFALFAPYVLLFEKRCPEPNGFVKRLMAKGHVYNICDPIRHIEGTYDAAIEVGMFASVLTSICLEKGIAVSYTGCLPSFIINEKFKFIESFVFLALSIGYPSNDPADEIENARERRDRVGETKPSVDKIISWV